MFYIEWWVLLSYCIGLTEKETLLKETFQENAN